MPFLLLLFLTLACFPDEWSEPWGPMAVPTRSMAFTWGGVAFVAVMARAVALGVRLRLQGDPDGRELTFRRYSRWRLQHTLLLMAVYALSLYVFGWGWTVQRIAGKGNEEIPGAELLTLAPFFVSLLLSWAFFYDAERALHDAVAEDEPFWPRRAYVLFHLRQNLALVFVPILLLVCMKGLRRLLPEGDDLLGTLSGMAGLVLSAAVFIAMPWILRLILGLRPLPEGPLRDRLLSLSQSLKFRCSDILVWNTRQGIANAMVAGIVPWVRYVLFTDRLLSELSPEEVEAVFGHEVGHVKHGHMLYYLGFLMISLMVLFAFGSVLAPYLSWLPEVGPSYQSLPLIAALGTYIFVVFGFLSRRCERQADLYGCRAVSCHRTECFMHDGSEVLPAGKSLCATGIRTFIEALEKVARLNGVSRDRPGWLQSWQHSTIARRVAFLQQVLSDPGLERRFQHRIALIKWGLMLGLGAGLLILGRLESESNLSPSEPTPANFRDDNQEPRRLDPA